MKRTAKILTKTLYFQGMDLRRPPRRQGRMLAALAALVPAMAAAQPSQSDPPPAAWRYGFSLYGYLPSLSGTSSAPADAGGTPISIDADKLVDSLKFTVMGVFEAHNGRWGLFTDLLYLNLGGNKQQSSRLHPRRCGASRRHHGQPRLGLQGGDLDARRRVPRVRRSNGHGRRARWGSLVRRENDVALEHHRQPRANPSGGSLGQPQNKVSVLDGIVGVKGRARLGSASPWSVPFYVDVGGGESDLTWQAMGGISYAFKWGEITAMWRYSRTT